MNAAVTRHIISRIVCWILLLQLINISIDAPDPEQITRASSAAEEDMPINDIESIYELVAEKVFEKDVPEGDENDIDSASQSFDLYCLPPQPFIHRYYANLAEYEAHYLSKLSFDSPEPNFPPPKLA